jgi:two-component system chemotaxis sensor kinase CheA
VDERNQYLQMFFDEAAENLQILNKRILELEKRPESSREIIDSMFRAAHSLKGMAATMGFAKLTELSHKIENLMDEIRKGQREIDDSLIKLLFKGIDHIGEIISCLKNRREERDISGYLQKIADFIGNKRPVNIEQDKTAPFELVLDKEEIQDIKNRITPTNSVYRLTVVLARDSLLDVRAYMVLKKAAEVGYIFKASPDKEKIEKEEIVNQFVYLILISNLSPQDIKREIEEITDVVKVKVVKDPEFQDFLTDDANNNRIQKTNKFQVSPTVRVDINKLDQLMNMVGELLINKTRLESLNLDNETYKDILPQLDRVTMELHHLVMQVRMVPVGVIFNRFPRMVRDLSKQMGKEVNFIIEGEDTELDRSIIDELTDPLNHLLRNAIDHGIESPAFRERKGKEKVGTVLLKAYQKGSEIIIEVEDNGQGINPDNVVKVAIEKGVIAREQAEEMGEIEKLNLIFEPGFSTAREVSDVSGRGVGLDVVKKVVDSLDGNIILQSQPGTGTRFIISLPLTLAITRALMVKINGEVFAIPLNVINETLEIEASSIKRVKGQDVIVLRNRTIPLVDSRERLNLNVEYGLYKERNKIPVVTINSGEKQFGLVVDELLNQQEIVVKSLNDFFGDIKNISGATIIGDGDVALILDVRNIA